MSVGVSSGNTSITGSVTSTPNKFTVTPLQATVTSATTDIATVGAGKVWRIVGFILTSSAGSTLDGGYLKFNAVNVCKAYIQLASAVGIATISQSMNFDYSACPVLTAGQVINVVSPGGMSQSVSIFYVEESA